MEESQKAGKSVEQHNEEKWEVHEGRVPTEDSVRIGVLQPLAKPMNLCDTCQGCELHEKLVKYQEDSAQVVTYRCNQYKTKSKPLTRVQWMRICSRQVGRIESMSPKEFILALSQDIVELSQNTICRQTGKELENLAEEIMKVSFPGESSSVVKL